jgi:4'-phosphopantetheinyl transferase
MPLHRLLTINQDLYSLIWVIEETEEDLLGQLSPTIPLKDYEKIYHTRRRLEWIAARLALQKLCDHLGYTYQAIVKNFWGKPYLANNHFYISLAHSFPFAVAAISPNGALGVDIQSLTKKLQNIRHKYLNPTEDQDSGQDLEKLAIYWCAKEALYKAYGGKGLSLREETHIKPFTKSSHGILEGQARGHYFTIHYSLIGEHILACCQAKGPN